MRANADHVRRARQLLGAVGSASVRRRRVGGAAVRQRRVGAPARRVPQGYDEVPIEYSAPEYRNGDVSLLGFVGDEVAPGDVVEIYVPTQRPFNPDDLRFPSTLEGLVLLQVNIEGTNLLGNSEGVPLELLSEVTTMDGFEWYTIQPATGLYLMIGNVGDEPQIPRGGLHGTAVRQ